MDKKITKFAETQKSLESKCNMNSSVSFFKLLTAFFDKKKVVLINKYIPN